MLGESFNKEQWIRELKQLNKEWNVEKDQVYKPMVILKKEYPTFIDECSKEISKMKSDFKSRSKLMVEGIYNIRVKV